MHHYCFILDLRHCHGSEYFMIFDVDNNAGCDDVDESDD